MKIIGGRFRGQTLEAPTGRDTRPTGARAREAVFNILENGTPDVDFSGITVLDAFAGTGGLGFEAMSRGAANAIFLDRAPDALKVIRRNAGKLGVIRECVILRLDAAKLGHPPRVASPADLVFLDPPYGEKLVEPCLLGLKRHGWLNDGAIVVAETEAKYDLLAGPGYDIIDVRDYGAARMHFLRYTTD